MAWVFCHIMFGPIDLHYNNFGMNMAQVLGLWQIGTLQMQTKAYNIRPIAWTLFHCLRNYSIRRAQIVQSNSVSIKITSLQIILQNEFHLYKNLDFVQMWNDIVQPCIWILQNDRTTHNMNARNLAIIFGTFGKQREHSWSALRMSDINQLFSSSSF